MQPENNSPEMCEDSDSWVRFKTKRHDFECLEPADVSSDFYRDYYLSIKNVLKYNSSEVSAIKKLDQYVETTNIVEKYQIIRTLTICLSENRYGVKVSIFNEFHPRAWGMELLIHTLLSNNGTWNVKHMLELVRVVNGLDTFIKENAPHYCVEEVLEILMKAQKSCQLDIRFIIKVVKLLCSHVQSLEIIFKKFCHLPSIVDELEILRLKNVCDQRNIIYTEKTQVVRLHNLLLYSEETVDSILAKLKENVDITDLIDFLETLKKMELLNTEDFLRQLTPCKDIENWKHELSFSLIRNFILLNFPMCHPWPPNLENAKNWCDVDVNKQSWFVPYPNLNNEEPCTKYCEFDKKRQNEWKRTLQDPTTYNPRGSLFAIKLYELNIKLAELIIKCGWSVESLKIIEKWIQCLDHENKITELIGALDILVEYEVDITQSELTELISQAVFTNVQKEVHKFVIDKAFPGTYEKPLNQLIEELIESNVNEGVSILENKDLLLEKYNKVLDAYDGRSSIYRTEMKIKDWSESEVRGWVKVAAVRFSPSTFETLAVIIRAVNLASRFHPRDIQLLSMILMLDSNQNKGRLMQINTGEGKTTIIAMVAAYHAMQGNKVDIITSSKVLAIPQSEEQAKFYKMLGLSVAHNFDSATAYLCDIVYGTSQQFQGDILRDEFRKNGMRRGRKCDIAIVDEVDSMLFDGINHIVMLSSNMPGMDNLELILAEIYMQVKNTAACVIEMDGKAYLKDIEGPLECTKKEFIENFTENHIRNLIRDCDKRTVDKSMPEIKVPNHLREFICKTQLKKWINSALRAQFQYVNGEHYIIVGEEVTVVDAENTGVVQSNMIWSDGLHQFLQIRHGAKITPESLTTNFISNVSFFLRYRPKIYGLSGTLGSTDTKRMLSKSYDVDTVLVPPFMHKQHKELTAIVVAKRDDWYKSIARSCLPKLYNGRAVLVIMEYIREAEILEDTFKKQYSYNARKIRMYKTNDDSAVVKRILQSGDIIITTNIAGRGTDIKLSKDIESNGGLHVCVTFMPKNTRVEQQNIGRTARTGNRGTSQFILLSSEKNLKELQNKRAEEEEQAMLSAEKHVFTVTTKDKIFQEFCRLIDVIKGRNEFVRQVEKEAVEERFAIWMKMNENRISDEVTDHVLQDFKSFRTDILYDDDNGNLIKNPYMYVKIGNMYRNKKEYTNAIREYTLAIELDDNFAEHAYYNRGYSYITHYGGDVSGNKNFIDQAVVDLKKARELINERKQSLLHVEMASDAEVFLERITNKSELYDLQKQAIDLAIGPDPDALSARINELEEMKKTHKFTSNEMKDITKIIEDLKNMEIKEGVIQTAISNGWNLKIASKEIKTCSLNDKKSHNKEIEEFERNGAVWVFEVSEVKPISWGSVFGLIALGIGQLVAGALTVGAVASFGMSLIAGGISDIVAAVRDCIINRDFSWVSWGLGKAYHYVTSFIAVGMEAMVKYATSMYQVSRTTIQQGWLKIAKTVGTALGKAGGKVVATESIHQIIETVVPSIEQHIIGNIQVSIEEALLQNVNVKKMLQLDKRNNNRYYETRIKNMGREILNSLADVDIRELLVGIANKIASTEGYVGTAAGIAIPVAGVVELTTFTKRFIDKLNNSIKKETENKIDQHQSGISVLYNVSEHLNGDINFNRANDEQIKREKGDIGSIAKEFAKFASNSMIQIIHNQFEPIRPLRQDTHISDTLTSNTEESDFRNTEIKTFIQHQNKGSSEKVEQADFMKKCIREGSFAINKVDEIIENARKGDPSGLLHLAAVSDAVDRPIEVYDEKRRFLYTIGEAKQGKPVKVEYHVSKNGVTVGHFTSPDTIEPVNNAVDEHLCLYDVIGEQTGYDSNHLKNLSLTIMEGNKWEMAKKVSDIIRLQMYMTMKLTIDAANYTGKCSDHAKSYIDDSTLYIPDKSTTDQLEAVAAEAMEEIQVYEYGALLYTVGDKGRGLPIKLEYHVGVDDSSAKYFTSTDCNGAYRFHNSLDNTFYEVIARQSNQDAAQLASNVANRINTKNIPRTIRYAENAMKLNACKARYISKGDMNFVKHYAVKYYERNMAKGALTKLTEYITNFVGGGKQRTVTLSKEQLDLPREAFAIGKLWDNGKLVLRVWPVESILLLIQHHDGQQGNSNAPTYVYTTYPNPPDNYKITAESKGWGPFNMAERGKNVLQTVSGTIVGFIPKLPTSFPSFSGHP